MRGNFSLRGNGLLEAIESLDKMEMKENVALFTCHLGLHALVISTKPEQALWLCSSMPLF